MEFFSKIGIDWWLLIAQILNFGILLYLLKRFLYKPIIKRIEKDENELEQAQIKKKILDEERAAFLRQKKDEINEARQYNQKIITEADDIAKRIMQSTREKADDENYKLIKQLRSQLKSHELTLRKEYSSKMKDKMVSGFVESIERILPAVLRKELQNNYFHALLQEIDAFSSDLLKKMDIPPVLEYVFPPEQKQTSKIEELLMERCGEELTLSLKQNTKLLSGFSFELNGIFIEKNLLSDLKNAPSSKKEE